LERLKFVEITEALKTCEICNSHLELYNDLSYQ
jgi:hypothetical protein